MRQAQNVMVSDDSMVADEFSKVTFARAGLSDAHRHAEDLA